MNDGPVVETFVAFLVGLVAGVVAMVVLVQTVGPGKNGDPSDGNRFVAVCEYMKGNVKDDVCIKDGAVILKEKSFD